MIRFGKKADFAAINKLRRKVNDLHVKGRPDIFKPGFDKDMENLTYDMLKNADRDIFVALREDCICGMACVEYKIKPESRYSLERKICHIHEFCVDEAFQRQGVGRELLEFIAEQARKKGFPGIQLSVWEFNPSAIQFYEAFGFYTSHRTMEFPLDIPKKPDYESGNI